MYRFFIALNKNILFLFFILLFFFDTFKGIVQVSNDNKSLEIGLIYTYSVQRSSNESRTDDIHTVCISTWYFLQYLIVICDLGYP